MPEFDFSETIPNTNWIVDGLIPAGQLGLVLAQAGIGKSLVVEDLAVHVAFAVPFCGIDTVAGDVLIIDQDTPSDILSIRLKRFALGTRAIKKHSLFVETMCGYSLANGSLISIINKHPTVRLVIIDSLHSVSEGLNTNHTSDMNILAKLKRECLRDDMSILVNHHITEKVTYAVERLMMEDTHSLSMGSSAIIQQADTYYIVGANASSNGVTETVFLRPVAKRQSINTKPLILKMLQLDNGGETLEFKGYFELGLSNLDADLLLLFRQGRGEGAYTVKETYERTGHQYGENQIRKGLASLEERGLLTLGRHAHNLFKYRSPS